MKVAIYARVSTLDQSPLMQVDALRAFCEARSWEIYREYIDQGVSGSVTARPFLEEMMRDAVIRKFAVVLVWKFDRLFRSVEHMLGALEHFRSVGVEFVSLTEAIDTTTPAGKMVFTLLAAMAEFERDLIRERTRAGMARARAEGHKIGRPPARVDEKLLQELRYGTNPLTIRQIAKKVGISQTVVFKRLQQAVPKGAAAIRNSEDMDS